MSRIKLSPASLLRSQIQARRAAGHDVIALTSGDLDFPTPDHVIAAAHAAALRGETKYTTVDGTIELKDAVRVRVPSGQWSGLRSRRGFGRQPRR